jgi:hypothetical protein
MEKVPESEVIVPDVLPSMVTDTFARGLSFSSTTLPEIRAVFFWAEAGKANIVQMKMRSRWVRSKRVFI